MNDKRKIIIELDGICRQIVLKRERGKCQMSNIRYNLAVAHLWGKGAYPHLRFDIENLFLLYRDIHDKFDKEKEYRTVFKAFALVKLGAKRYDKLAGRAQVSTGSKSIRYYKELREELKKLL